MHSNASTVDEYLQEVPNDRLDTIKRIRSLCQASLPAFEEVMEDGKPVYKKDGEIKAGFSSQAHHIAFYVTDPVVRATYEAEFSDPDDGMVQFNKADAVDFELIEKLLHDTGKVANRH